jgi:hypothetical protein
MRLIDDAVAPGLAATTGCGFDCGATVVLFFCAHAVVAVKKKSNKHNNCPGRPSWRPWSFVALFLNIFKTQ